MFSIIIPAYNCESCLKRCVESVLGQTCPDWEALIVDDGSTDGTPAVAQELCARDGRIRYIRQPNGGVSAARNTGIDAAQGDYVLFLDADDYWESDTLETLRERVRSSGEDAVVVFNFAHNDGTRPVLPMGEGGMDYPCGSGWIRDFLAGDMGETIAHSVWNKVFVRSVLSEKGLRFPAGVAVGEDMIFTLQYLSYFHRLELVDRALYHYIISTTSAMNSVGNYLPKYEKTAVGLEQTMVQGQPLDREALAHWALKALTFVLTNPYVTGMDIKTFRQFYRESSGTRLLALARQGGKIGNRKRDVLAAVLRSNSPLLLYAIVKANHHA